MNSIQNIEAFFEKWGLSLIERNKDTPLSNIFLAEFKTIFEKYVTIEINGRVFRRSFESTKCKNCVLDYLIELQLFYRRLKKRNKGMP